MTLDGQAAVTLLARILRGTPHLSGAACIGNSELFDTVEPLDAEPALTLCARCPALEPCRTWADSQPRNTLSGVVAGQIRLRPDQRPKKPKPKPKPRPRPALVPSMTTDTERKTA